MPDYCTWVLSILCQPIPLMLCTLCCACDAAGPFLVSHPSAVSAPALRPRVVCVSSTCFPPQSDPLHTTQVNRPYPPTRLASFAMPLKASPSCPTGKSLPRMQQLNVGSSYAVLRRRVKMTSPIPPPCHQVRPQTHLVWALQPDDAPFPPSLSLHASVGLTLRLHHLPMLHLPSEPASDGLQASTWSGMPCIWQLSWLAMLT